MGKTKRHIKFHPSVLPIALLVVFIICASFSEVKLAQQKCTDLKITIDKNAKHSDFLTVDDVCEYLEINRNMIIGQLVADVDVNELEEKLDRNPFVESCEVFVSVLGELNIIIKQRTPLVRVISSNGESFYVDELGYEMPISNENSSRVIVASGDFTVNCNSQMQVVKDTTNPKVLLKVFALARMIVQDAMLESLIEQIYVTKNGEYKLATKVGPEIVELGKFDELLPSKLEKLKAFYLADKVHEQWYLYKSISLKFNNQIVCTKK